MKKTIQAALYALLLLPSLAFGQTVFNNGIQVSGSIAIEGPGSNVIAPMGSGGLYLGSSPPNNDLYDAMKIDFNGASIGFSNNINNNSTAVFQFGGLLTTGTISQNGDLIVMGFNNTDLGFSPDDYSDNMGWDNHPLFVIGNGYFPWQTANALVMLKSGHTTITNRNYVQPTPNAPFPANEPEALAIEGSSTVNGDSTVLGSTTMQGQVNMTQRQGDIWMGSFGNAADAGPSN